MRTFIEWTRNLHEKDEKREYRVDYMLLKPGKKTVELSMWFDTETEARQFAQRIKERRKQATWIRIMDPDGKMLDELTGYSYEVWQDIRARRR